MFKSLVSGGSAICLGLSLAGAPVAHAIEMNTLYKTDAPEAVESAEVLEPGAPAAQLGVGGATAMTAETMVHIGGLIFVVAATGAVLAGSGGSSGAATTPATTN